MEVIKTIDCIILCGFRGKNEQHRAFMAGTSKLDWPHGKHNSNPSNAVDVAPYPIDWSGRQRFITFAQKVLEIAGQLGIRIRWGGDWDMKGDGNHNGELNDFVHFELV